MTNKTLIFSGTYNEAKNILLSNPSLQNQIIELFRNQVTSNNTLDLSKLSDYVFSNQKYQQNKQFIHDTTKFTLIYKDYLILKTRDFTIVFLYLNRWLFY